MNCPACGAPNETAGEHCFSCGKTVSQRNSVVLTRTGTINPASESQRFSFVN